MAGTKAGGLKTAATNKAKYGDDYYAIIGRQGGKNGHTGGFASNRELASRVGAIGGQISKRGKAKSKDEKKEIERQKLNTAKFIFQLLWGK